MKKLIYIFSFILLFAFLIWASKNEIWKYHLAFDIGTFYARYRTFFETNSFVDFGGNEYLPMSLFLFILPGVFNRFLSWDGYFNFFLAINLLLILGHLYIYPKIHKKGSLFLPLILFAAAGPILLFRFELLVSFLFLLSIYFFVKEKYKFSGLFFGLSVATKVYPLFTLPYFLIVLFRQKKLINVIRYLLASFLGVYLPFLLYFLGGGNTQDILKNLTFHLDKPIGLESLPASFMALSVFIKTNALPGLINAHSVWGLPDTSSIGVSLLPYLAVVVLSLIFLFTSGRKVKFEGVWPILIISTFLLTSKYLNPQYLIWAFGLIPIVDFRGFRMNGVVFINCILILALTQLTYPVFFSEILESFGSGPIGPAYWVLQVRNLLMILEVGLLLMVVGLIPGKFKRI